uniref:acetate--CoA ligase n=1 Tax=Elaeophora elaphi TaxID=1147741 RepID=A0A0R3RVH9_9BILA
MADKNLSYECADAWKSKIQKETARIYWIGNYYDSEVYDDTELSAETVDILVNKCADVFRGFQLKDKPIVLYLPNVLQLPITVLAALRIGLTVLPITATNEDVGSLRDILRNSGADTVVTIDGFWMGTRLIRTKELLDAAITDIAIERVLVIRHVSPDEGIPPPQVNLTGRRPYYLYKVAMKQKRDLWWSGFFQKASSSCKPKAVPSESITLLLPTRSTSSTAVLLPISLEMLQTDISHVQTVLHPNELSLIISTTNVFHQIICILAALKSGAIPLIYESDIRHPDPSRTSQIIYTYKVVKLLIAEKDLSLLMEYKQYMTLWDLKTLREIVVLGSNKLCEQAKEIFGVPCRNINPTPI